MAFALALFLPAGTLAWPAGWVFLLLFFGFYIAVTLWLFRHNPGLMQERLRLGTSDQQGWDKVLYPLMLVYSICSDGFYVLRRSSFSLVFHAGLASDIWSNHPVGLVLFAVFDVPLNLYLASVVRIQEEARARGCVYRALQACASSHVCRHPSLYGRNVLPAGFLVWIVFCIPFYRPDGLAGSAGRKDFARQTHPAMQPIWPR